MYRLIIMDYKMPVCNGLDATIQIRKILERNRITMPYFVCLTNFKENYKIRMASLEAGMDEFVGKPIFKSGIYRLLVAAELDPPFWLSFRGVKQGGVLYTQLSVSMNFTN